LSVNFESRKTLDNIVFPLRQRAGLRDMAFVMLFAIEWTHKETANIMPILLYKIPK